MLFPTFGFGLFFLAIYLLAWALSASNEWRKIALLLASWFFYGAWDGRFVALLIASAAANWATGRLIAASERASTRKALIWLGVAANLGVLGWFKYVGFFSEQLGALLGTLGLARDVPLLTALLPVGISFFTFQAISYLVDVHRGKVAPAGLLDLMLLMSFFPHLVAGPIVRASDLLPQFAQAPRADRGRAAAGLLLIVWGLFKKAVIASELATALVDPAFFDPASRSSLDLLIAAYGYAVQIFCDFSAYTDMAIGIAALLGYTFPRNFDQPYRARSLQDFWRRWHISLSSWLRDYLYIPLGGGRGSLAFACRNLMLTMLLGGLWHGASFNFIIWGAWHGLVQSVERVWRDKQPAWWRPLPIWAGVLITFHIVLFGWIFFRAPTLPDAMTYLRGLLTTDWRNTLVTPLSLGLVALGIGINFLPARWLRQGAERIRRWPAPALGVAVGALILVIDTMRPAGVAPFIYYQF